MFYLFAEKVHVNLTSFDADPMVGVGLGLLIIVMMITAIKNSWNE